MKRTMMGMLCILALIGCNQAANDAEVPLTSGIETANMDTTVRPQDDFFMYVNGTWLNTTEIPADRTNMGVFMDLRDRAR